MVVSDGSSLHRPLVITLSVGHRSMMTERSRREREKAMSAMRKFSRPDLKRYDVSRAKITSVLGMQQDVWSYLPEPEMSRVIQDSLPRGIHWYSEYRVKDSHYRISVNLLEFLSDTDGSDNTKLLGCTLTYQDISDEVHPYARKVPESAIAAIFEMLSDPHFAEAEVVHELTGVSGQELWFPLPTVLSGNDADSDFFEINSVRGSKINPERHFSPEYKFSISLPRPTEPRIEFSFDIDQLSPRSAMQAIRQSNTLLKDMLPRVGSMKRDSNE